MAGQARITACHNWMAVGVALRRILARSAGGIRRTEDGAPALQPLVHAGMWERMFEALTTDRDNQYVMIDSRVVRDRGQAATGKAGARIRC